jgi:UDP-glucose 4-epimerase
MDKTHANIFVTGGAGFIGSHIVPALLEKGYNVTVFDNLTTGKLKNLNNARKNPSFTFIKGDIRKPTEIQRALKNTQAIVHLAAQIDVATSVSNPIETHEINTTGTFNLLQAAAKNRVEKFVFASSTAVYGDTDKLPITEDIPLKPLSPYAASKAAGEAYCTAYANCYNLNTTALRFFNVYGTGNENNPYSGVITKFMQNAQKNQALTIEGDGEQTRDFIHASDVAEAICQALKHGTTKTGVFNVCTGVQTSINQLVDTLKKVIGKNLQVSHGPKRTGDIKKSYGNPEKAAKELGFRSKVPLLKGLETLVETLE